MHFENADLPIDSNDVGRLIVFNLEYFSNDESSILITDSGIVISMTFLKISWIGLIISIFEEKIKCFKLEQLLNELSFIFVL